MKRLTVTALLLLLCSCDRVPAPKQTQPEAASPFRAPSATELFDLQSKCTLMGERIMRESPIGSGLTQEQVSRYDPKDNRCYVKLSVRTEDLTLPSAKLTFDDFLYDGQTSEMLAAVTDSSGKRAGSVYDSSLKKRLSDKQQSQIDYDSVSDLIDSFVATDRRP